MMADWGGFSDEDLRRMKQQSTRGPDGRQNRPRPSGPPQRGNQPPQGMNRTRATPPRGKIATKIQIPDQSDGPAIPISPDQMLSRPKPVPKKAAPTIQKEAATSDTSKDAEKPESKKETVTEKEAQEKPTEPKENKVENTKEMEELNEEEGISREFHNLEIFQQQQKLMEEQNKQKKKLLASAIVERQRRAKAESNRLVRVQRELDKLDTMLNADVSIIRDKIEEASREFLEAQKRFEMAEKEYIEAKMDLFHKQEAKENLTEHLCTIIHENEVRKGKKLLDLMEKLDMEVEAEEVPAEVPTLPTVVLSSVKLTGGPKSPVQQPVTSQPETKPEVADSAKTDVADSAKKDEGTPNTATEKIDTVADKGTAADKQTDKTGDEAKPTKSVVENDASDASVKASGTNAHDSSNQTPESHTQTPPGGGDTNNNDDIAGTNLHKTSNDATTTAEKTS